MTKVTLSMSIHAFKDSDINKAIDHFTSLGIDKVHFDVMDGIFAPTVSFSQDDYKEITSKSKATFDVHLMVDDPEKQVSDYILLKPELITFHVEALEDEKIIPLIKEIQSAGIKAGLAFEIDTDPKPYLSQIEVADFILIMSVPIGYSGQKFRSEVLKKVKYFKNKVIGIDGGVTKENIEAIKNSGISYIVMGSLLKRLENPKEDIKEMKGLNNDWN